MVSTIRYRSFKDLDLKAKRPALLVPLFALVLAAIAYRPEAALTALLGVFAASGPLARAASFVSSGRKRDAAA